MKSTHYLYGVTLLIAVHFTACASITGKRRIAIGSAFGGGIGAMGGAILAPTDDNRGLNALVFGLGGALIGGIIALVTESEPVATQPTTLKDRELGSATVTREIEILPSHDLPEFLKNRVQPVVIEEYLEADRVTEEGTLHEPHKAYRIKRPVELFAHPVDPVPKPMPKLKGTP